MKNRNEIISISNVFVFCSVIPLMMVILVNYQPRNLLKDTISFLTIVLFSLLSAQFICCGRSWKFFGGNRAGYILKIHNIVGYTILLPLILHPFYLVIPRFFEGAMEPLQAFIQIMTTFTPGIVLGYLSYGIMILLLLTAFLRKRLPVSYRFWRLFHGLLAAAFLATATLHVVNIGRHINQEVAVLLTMYCIGALLFYFNNLYRKT